MRKRLLFLASALMIALSSFAYMSGTYSGTFDGGEYVITCYSSGSAVLSVVTHGKPMPDFGYPNGPAPWVSYNEMYGETNKIVKITTDASSIGAHAFRGFHYVSTIEAENCKKVGRWAFYKTGREGFTMCLPKVEEAEIRAFTGCYAGVIALPKIKEVPYECFLGCPYLKQVDFGEDLTEIEGWAFGCCPMMWIDDEPNIILHGSKMPELNRGYYNPSGTILVGYKVERPDTVNYSCAYHYGTCFDDQNLEKTRLLFPYISAVSKKKGCSLFYPQPDGLHFNGKPVVLISHECYSNDWENVKSRISDWKDDANFYVGGRVETCENPISKDQTWRNGYIGWWHKGCLIGYEDVNICTYQWKLKEYISEEEARTMLDQTALLFGGYDPHKDWFTLHDNLPKEVEAIRKLQLNSGMPWMKAMQASLTHGGVHVKTPAIIPYMFGPSLNCYTTNSAFEGVTRIGTGAFAFTGLQKTIDLSEVTYIGEHAFFANNFLTEATLSKIEKMEKAAFCWSDFLTKVTLGSDKDFTSIPEDAFLACRHLDEVYIDKNVTSIGASAFQMTGLDSDNSEKGLFMSGKAPALGDLVFQSVTLSKIYLHYPFAEYASYDADGSVWREMNRVSDISFPIEGDGWTLYADGEMDIFKDIPDYSNETQQPWAKYRRYITEVFVEEGVTQIGNHAFHFTAEQSRLKYVALPASLKRIGNYAFAGNDELEAIVSWPGIANCNAEDYFIYLKNVEEIGDYAFADCSKMWELYLGSSIKQLGKYIVKGCPILYIAAYTAPISIDRYTFEGTIDGETGKPKATSDIWCDVRTEDFGIKLEYLTATWWSDLHYALGDKEVWYNTSFRSANFALLSDSTLYIWPEGDATDLLAYATWERDAIAWDQRIASSKWQDFGTDNKVADKVKRVEVLGNVKSLGGACCFLPNLEEVSLPESLKMLRGTFYGCEKLKSVHLPYVEVLGGATGVTVSSRVNRFDKETHGVDLYMGTFAHCPNLATISMPKLRLIGDSTFCGCYALDDYWDGIYDAIANADTICTAAFKDCRTLESPDVSHAKYLGTSVFAGCTKLRRIYLGNNQPRYQMFEGCSKLEEVYMGGQIGSIGNKAFNGCNIKDIYITTPNPPDFDLNSKETIKDHIFNGLNLSEINVYTYGDFIARYRETPGWKEMAVRVIPETETYAAIPTGGYLTDENWTNPAKWELTVGRTLNIYGKGVLDAGDYIDPRVSYFWDYIDEIRINSGITELNTKIQGPRVLGSASPAWGFTTKVYIPSTMEKICNLAFNAHAVMGGNKITDVYCYAENPVDISYSYDEYDAGDKGKMIFGSTAFSAVMMYTGEGTESENEELRQELAIPRLHVLKKKGVKEAYEAASGYNYSFLEIIADLSEDGEIVAAEKYSVTFIDWDERWITTTVVEEGGAAVAPEDPVREGYKFIGWDTDFDNVTENITVKAKYNFLTYKVTLVAENGTILTNEEDPFDINTVPYNYKLHLTAVPDEGYAFDYWENYNPETGLTVTSDTTVTAHFAKLHTVAFVDWDEKEISNQQVKNGSQATAPDDPAREGYSFLGWLSSANGQTMSATDINATSVTAEVTYTAQYQGGPYHVTLIAENGEIEVLNSSIDLNAVPENTVLQLVWYTTKGGWQFDHWTNYNEETGLVVTSDTTVTAHFVMQTYTVTFLDWDETILKEETVDWGGKVTAPADPTREGWTFIGWDTNEYIEVYYDITVRAQYQEEAVVHTLSFVDWNGENIIDVKVVDGSNPLVPENPTREGYTFIGWLSSETSEIISALEIGLSIPTSDITYTAQYEKSIIYHTVTFIDWNGDELLEEKVEDGKDAKGPEETPTREGYTFIGWSKPITNVTTNLFVVAQYEETKVYYTVTYLDWNGDFIDSESVEEGHDAKGLETNPTREGYTFTGWSKPLTNITSNLTVIALYEISTGINDVQRDDVQVTKVLHNGVLYLMYNGTMYNVQGQKVK